MKISARTWNSKSAVGSEKALVVPWVSAAGLQHLFVCSCFSSSVRARFHLSPGQHHSRCWKIGSLYLRR